MAYISGTLTSANPAADLYALIAPALTTAGYTLVDTVVISTRTHKVWKSAAADNVQNLDWFLDVAYTTTGVGSVWLSPFEDFNPTTDLGFRGPYNASNASIEGTYYSRYGATGYALETNWATVSSNNNSIEASTTSFGYWISITINRVIGLSTVSAAKTVYCGLFEPSADHVAHAGASLFPLIVGPLTDSVGIDGTNTSNTMVTRAPKATAISNWFYMPRLWSYGAYHIIPEGGFGVLGDISVNPYIGAQTPRGRSIYVVFPPTNGNALGMNTAGAAANITNAAIVGKLRDVLVFAAVPSVSRGDTTTINGDTWILGSKLSSYYAAYAFKAA